MKPRISPRRNVLLIALVWICAFASTPTTNAWEWTDWLGDVGAAADDNPDEDAALSMQQISDLRVRDIKRRLARRHGYSAEELARILDKKELIQALAFEEHKTRLQKEEKLKRKVIKRGILTAIVAVAVAMCWPLISHGYEVAAINFVVYTDRKKLEASRCWELQSKAGFVGIFIMFIIDLLSAWLTVSILLSWVMRSKYFFPTPSLPIRPAQLMGGQMAQSSLSNYGLNVGPMAISWIMRFLYARVEGWTGKALSSAHRTQRKAARDHETQEERAARKEARKQARREAKARKQEAALAREQQNQEQRQQQPPTTLPQGWMQEAAQQTGAAPTHVQASNPASGDEAPTGPVPGSSSREHQEFLEQMDQHNSVLDDLD